MTDTGPGSLLFYGLCDDGAQILLFGGQAFDVGARGVRNTTWSWDGKHWTLRQNIGPGPRMGVSMAYDRLRKRAVIFGGRDQETRLLSDTWELAEHIPNPGTGPDSAPSGALPSSTRRGRSRAG